MGPQSCPDRIAAALPHEIDERPQLRLRLASAVEVEVESLRGEKIGPQHRAMHAFI
jgi:hypothetical protein